jgi:hypothetical protein
MVWATFWAIFVTKASSHPGRIVQPMRKNADLAFGILPGGNVVITSFSNLDQ